jgi:hypothetical protein
MLVYAERLPSSPAELSAIVRIAAKRSPRNWKRSSTIISPHPAPSVSTTGRSSRLRCKPASTQDSQHQLMPNGRFAPKAALGRLEIQLPLYPRKQTLLGNRRMSEKCHVWTAPSWQELSSRTQRWSVQPCVRPLAAVHMTAGHNALRGSGPGQKLAFDNAMALVGCPDRRIDRLCITCCSPSQPHLHITPAVRRDLVYAASATGCL